MPRIDSRWVTTPLGALVGLALTRKLVPKEDLNALNQTAGTLAGAGLGHMGGGFLNESLNAPAATDYDAHKAYRRQALKDQGPDFRGPITEADIREYAKHLPDDMRNIPGGSDRLMDKAFVPYVKSMIAKERAQLGQDSGWPEYTKHWQGVFDQNRSSLEGLKGSVSRLKGIFGL
jgi:hypothetical protein